MGFHTFWGQLLVGKNSGGSNKSRENLFWGFNKYVGTQILGGSTKFWDNNLWAGFSFQGGLGDVGGHSTADKFSPLFE